MKLYRNAYSLAYVNAERLEVKLRNPVTMSFIARWSFYSLAAMERWLIDHGYTAA